MTTSGAAPSHEGVRLRSQASWVLLDQVISSATNAVLAIVIARSVGAMEFGAFSIAFIVFSFLVGLCRALVTDPLIVRFSAAESAEQIDAGRQAAGTSCAIGILGSVLSLVAAVALGGRVGSALFALAFVLPGLLVQDAWRQYFFAAGRARSAAVNDGVWALAQTLLLGGVLLLGEGSVATLTVAWGVAAGLAAAVGAVQVGGAPRVGCWLRWLRAHRDLSGHLAAGYSLNMASVHVTMALVGAIGGLAAVGALRAAQVLLGPLQVLYPGITSLALPYLSRRVPRGPRTLLVPAVSVSVFAATAAAAVVLVLLQLPTSLGQQLLGDSWELARSVLPAVGVMMALIGAAVGAALMLKALSQGARLLRVTLVQGPLILVLGCLGAYLEGARGAAYGLALAHLVGLVVVWFLVSTSLVSARRDTSPG